MSNDIRIHQTQDRNIKEALQLAKQEGMDMNFYTTLKFIEDFKP